MTESQGKTLKPGQRVRWSDGTLGKVHEVSYAAVVILWDDGQQTMMTFRDPATPWQNLEAA